MHALRAARLYGAAVLTPTPVFTVRIRKKNKMHGALTQR
ncbi:hypothetical protein AXX16_4576 [Serratia rubidaea]|nr:hypothetical protein AXX16_4576 [Serratia rubidaea]